MCGKAGICSSKRSTLVPESAAPQTHLTGSVCLPLPERPSHGFAAAPRPSYPAGHTAASHLHALRPGQPSPEHSFLQERFDQEVVGNIQWTATTVTAVVIASTAYVLLDLLDARAGVQGKLAGV